MNERIPCSIEQRQNCPLRQHFYNKHHIYWPANRYRTDLQQEFRNLPENIRLMCTNEHAQLHREEFPPKMPGVEEMIAAVMKVDAT